jgi:hypothetical protein
MGRNRVYWLGSAIYEAFVNDARRR